MPSPRSAKNVFCNVCRKSTSTFASTAQSHFPIPAPDYHPHLRNARTGELLTLCDKSDSFFPLTSREKFAGCPARPGLPLHKQPLSRAYPVEEKACPVRGLRHSPPSPGYARTWSRPIKTYLPSGNYASRVGYVERRSRQRPVQLRSRTISGAFLSHHLTPKQPDPPLYGQQRFWSGVPGHTARPSSYNAPWRRSSFHRLQ